MSIVGKFVVALAGAALLNVTNPAGHALPQNIPVNFGVTFRNARLAPLWIAEEQGYFKKEGLDVKQVNISGGTQGAQMMVSGGVDVS
ncbi:MAG TPA: ABC transporter substrate-binding protein, partial [Candidatus Binatia bacterium]